MSLSRRERSLLNEIGRQLLEEDPRFAARLGKPPRPASDARVLIGAMLLTLTGFAVLMTGAVLMSTALGVAGFVAMASGGILASRCVDPLRLRWVKRPPGSGIRRETSVD